MALGTIADEAAARIATSHPLPIADAVAALASADSLHERRDRVVECFRAAMRYLAALVLAVRVQHGSGPGKEPAQVQDLLRSLRRRGLTDGQWVGIMRNLLGSWMGQADAYPLPAVVALFSGRSKKKLAKLFDGLLEMRKSETVAHGATGTADAISALLSRREPQLEQLLAMLEPLWQHAQLVVPLAQPESADEAQQAWRLMGYTPARGRWPRSRLADAARVEPGVPILIDAAGRPLVSLAPIALFRRPTPEALEELFLLDGGKKANAVYVAFPSMAEHRASDVWATLGKSLLDEDDDAEAAASTRGATRPYRGLSSFEPEHAALFFGREKQAQSLANRIRRYPMVTVTGPSGSGKSSLLHAGVFPLLDDSQVITFRPGADPLAVLKRRLQPLLQVWPQGEQLSEVLDERPETLGSYLEGFSRSSGIALTLLVDQAEEVFTLCQHESRRVAFAEALLSAGLDGAGPTRVVLSLREDFFARLSTLPPLRGYYTRQVEVVTTPDREELTRILIAPAVMFGFSFEDLELVDAMVDAVHGEPAALAMLQFCADQLWERRDRTWKRLTWAAYRAVGGVEGALAAHAEQILTQLTPSQQAVARNMFLQLVTEEGTRAVVPRPDLLASAGARDDGEDVLTALVKARLLTSRQSEEAEGDGAPSIEVVHEALLRHWQRLRSWLEEDEELVRARARVAVAAQRWLRDDERVDLLLGDGKPLLEGSELLHRRADLLTPAEVRFVEASRQRGRRTRRLKRAAIGGLALLTVIALGFGGFAWWARGEAQHMATVAAANEKIATEQSVNLLQEQGRRELLSDQPLRALLYLNDANRRGGNNTALQHMLADAVRPADALIKRLPGHEERVRQLIYSRDGAYLLSADYGGLLQLWDGQGKRLHRWQAHNKALHGVRFSADGRLIVSYSDEASAKLWDVATAKLVAALPGHERRVARACFFAGGQRVATADARGWVRIWSTTVSDGEATPLLAWRAHSKEVASLDCEPTGKRLLTGSWDKTLRLWALDEVAADPDGSPPAESKPLRQWDGFTVMVRGRFADEGKSIVSYSGNKLQRWNADEGALLMTYTGHQRDIRSVRFSRDGSRMLTCSYDNSARVWDVATGKVLVVTGGHRDFARPGSYTPAALNDARFSPDERYIVSRGSDERVLIWDAATGHLLQPLASVRLRATALAYHPKGGALATANEEVMQLWRPVHGRLLDVYGSTAKEKSSRLSAALISASNVLALIGDRDVLVTPRNDQEESASPPRHFRLDRPGSLLALAPSGASALFAHKDGAALWDIASGKPLRTLSSKSQPIGYAVYAPDGNSLLLASKAGTSAVWSMAGERLQSFAGHEGAILFAAYSADGRRIVTVDRQQAKVWQVDSGELLLTTAVPKDSFNMFPSARLNGDGTRLLAMVGGLKIGYWDVASQKLLKKVDGNVASLHPTLERMVVADSSAPSARVVDARSGEVLASLEGHRDKVVGVRFLADGDRVATLSDDGTARLWDAVEGKLLTVLPAHAQARGLLLSPGPRQQLLTLGQGDAKRWSIDIEARGAPTLAEIVSGIVPWRLVDGHLVPRELTATP